MILRHWSAKPLGKLRNVKPGYRDEGPYPHGKPKGFWLSDESGEDGWAEWCNAESFNLDGLTAFTDFEIDLADVLHISDCPGMVEFADKYRTTEGLPDFYLKSPRGYSIDWPRVGADFKGILITPYIWEARFDMSWYYGWDCASACVWDVSCLTRLYQPSRRAKSSALSL